MRGRAGNGRGFDEKDKAAYLALYDREGNSLAEGEIHGQNGVTRSPLRFQ